MSLFRKEGSKSPLSESELEEAPPHFVQGELDNVIFVSVPPDTSYRACQRLQEMLTVAWGEKKVIVIITHNIELMGIRQLPKKEGAELIKKLKGEGARDEGTAIIRP